jgi:hypothetical protein
MEQAPRKGVLRWVDLRLLAIFVFSLIAIIAAVSDTENCATIFSPLPGSTISFSNPQTGQHAVYACLGTSLFFTANGTDPFGFLHLTGTLNRYSYTGAGIFSSPYAAQLTSTLVFSYNGIRRNGIVFLTPNGLGYQPDWTLYQVTSGTLTSIGNVFSIAIQGLFQRRQYQNAQIGSGASSGLLSQWGLGFRFNYRVNILPQIINGGGMNITLASACPCSRTANMSNFANLPFGSPDSFIQFYPNFSRSGLVFPSLSLNPAFFSFKPVIYGLSQILNPATHNQRYLFVRGFAQPILNTQAVFQFTLWFQGTDNNSPGTGYGAPLGIPQPDWQYFRLIEGVMSYVSNNSSYVINMLNSSFFPTPNSAPNQLGSYLQIGTNANIFTAGYGAYFPLMYKFNYGVTFKQATLFFMVSPANCQKSADDTYNMYHVFKMPAQPNSFLNKAAEYTESMRKKIEQLTAEPMDPIMSS